MRLSVSSLLTSVKKWKSGTRTRVNQEAGQDQDTKDENKVGKVWWYETFSILSVCTSCISCGNFLGFTSSAIPSMQADLSTFGELYSHQIALIGGLGPLGALLGAILSAIPLRFIGPRRTIALFGIPMLIASWVTIGLARGITPVLVGRFIGGVGVGSTISSAPLYVIDISSTSNRGKMGIMPQFLMISGIFIAYILGTFFSWSNLSLVISPIAIFAGFLIIFAPDSPKWLISNGNGEKGFHVLEKIHGTLDAEVLKQRIETSSLSSVALNPQRNGESIWRNKATIKSTVVCLGIISIQQLTGVNGITFFAASIFDRSSTTSSGGHLPSIILASTQLVASFISTFLVERFGRTFLLKISSATVTIAGLVLGLYFYFLLDHSEFSWLPLAALIIFAFGFAIGLGPVTWIIVAELLPQDVRNVINPLIIGYNWFCVFLITTSFPWLKDEIQYFGIFWLYASVAALGFIFVCCFVPETKGKSFEDIQKHFSVKRSDDNISSAVSTHVQVISVITTK